jgi:hypothetical protein
VKVGRLSVPVATAEDLIIMKAIANRPKDQIDIQGILESCSKLDYAHIRKHARDFADMLDAPEIFGDVDRFLLKHEKNNRRKMK